ncbi:DUF2000 family protein [Nisaea sediminum]|uniref:DUF2000 family protein n=1 Tax=Nisaea sediminum TaxID=2775867 RepID=UPI0018685E14|nr:DUF2000 family protein [Nisaea sediminum]
MFDTKVALVLRDDLVLWQKLNVTAFLTSGIVGGRAELMGEAYEDAEGNLYNPLLIQPVIVLSADAAGIKKIYERALARDVRMSLYIEDMFATGHDAANRATVKKHAASEMPVVGLAIRDERKLVDKVTKGARLQS